MDFVPGMSHGESKIGDMIYTYFIQREDGGPIKIGKSKNIEYRIDCLQGGCPVPLIGIAYIEGDWEAHAHKKFGHLCIGGEWFEDAPELLAFINKHATPSHYRADPMPPEETTRRAESRVEWMSQEIRRTRWNKPIVEPSWVLELK